MWTRVRLRERERERERERGREKVWRRRESLFDCDQQRRYCYIVDRYMCIQSFGNKRILNDRTTCFSVSESEARK